MQRSILAAIVLAATANVCHAASRIGLKEKTYSYGDEAQMAPVEQTFLRALADTNWVTLESQPGRIVAKTVVRFKYHAKIEINYGAGQARFRLLEGKNLDTGECVYAEGRKMFKGPCVHPVYYEWLDRLMAELPAAHQKVLATASKPAEPAAPVAEAAAAGDLSMTDLVLTALLTGSSEDIVLAGRSLQSYRTPALTDLGAQVLADTCDGRIALGEEAQSWLSKGIGATGTLRYRGVVEKCLAGTENPKLQKYFAIVLEAMTAPSEPFVPGSVDVAAARARARQQLKAGQGQPTAEAFFGMCFGATAQDVAAKLGMPVALGTGQTRSRVGGGPVRVRVATTQLAFEYEGFGALLFQRPNDGDKDWVFLAAEYDPALELLPPGQRILALRQQLSSFDPATARARIDVLRRAELRDTASLDIIAQHISDYRDAQDRHVVDALGHLCRVIGNSGHWRYHAFLKDEIGGKAASSALKRHARNSADLLKESSEQPFAPAVASR